MAPHVSSSPLRSPTHHAACPLRHTRSRLFLCTWIHNGPFRQRVAHRQRRAHQCMRGSRGAHLLTLSTIELCDEGTPMMMHAAHDDHACISRCAYLKLVIKTRAACDEHNPPLMNARSARDHRRRRSRSPQTTLAVTAGTACGAHVHQGSPTRTGHSAATRGSFSRPRIPRLLVELVGTQKPHTLRL